MGCKYSYYKEEYEYFPRLYCNIDDRYCMYSKKCIKENKFVPLESQKECYKMIERETKNIPKDSYFVQTYRPNKNGELFLYVVIGQGVERIQTKLKEINQNYVYLNKKASGYEVSLTPFPTQVQQQPTRKIKKK